MFSSILRVWSVAELRTKVLLTIALLLVFRAGTFLPAPGVNMNAIYACADLGTTGLLATINLFSGGALGKVSLLALGVMPYITASIILQLLQVVVPKLAALKKEGSTGQAKINQYTRYVTVALAAIQAGGLVWAARGNPSALYSSCPRPILGDSSTLALLVLGVALVAGALLVMWLGEQITEHGIGNGASLLMFTSIAASLPAQLGQVAQADGVYRFVLAAAAIVVLLVGIVFIEQGQRRVPVRYTRSNVVGASATYTPLKVNLAGVVPIIYASSLLYAPLIVANLLGAEHGFSRFVATYLASGTHPVYVVTYVVLCLAFTFFQVGITHDPKEMSERLAKDGGYVPGIRPGAETENYLGYVIGRLTTVGAVYLALLALLPLLALASLGSGVGQLPLGGTALLILVGVALETTRQFTTQVRQHLPYSRGLFDASGAKKSKTKKPRSL